jgi:molybdopterin molybdotransferase
LGGYAVVISYDEAIALTLGLVRPLGMATVPLAQAAGRILAAPVIARTGSPRAAVSAMDGYAVAGAALLGRRLKVIGEAFPGAPFEGTLGPGEAARIFTGAPVPSGADHVVMQENVRREGDEAVVTDAGSGATHVRDQGSDFQAGDVLLAAGRRLDPRAVVAAAAADWGEVEVWLRPRVVVLGTGDELLEPGSAHLTHYGVAESVSFGVAALAEAWGGHAIGRRRLADDLPSLRAAAAESLEAADVVVVTGGASVGERDFARAMFEDSGLELVFSKVEMKPGKPVWLGRAAGKLVLGLPGNPTSAMVTGRLFLAPLLLGLGGQAPEDALAWREERLASALPATGERETFYRGRTTPAGVEPFADQDSGSQKTLAAADILIRRRAGAPALAAGEAALALDF